MAFILHYSPEFGVSQTVRTNLTLEKALEIHGPALKPEFCIFHPVQGREAVVCARCCGERQNQKFREGHVDPILNLSPKAPRECPQCCKDYDRPLSIVAHYGYSDRYSEMYRGGSHYSKLTVTDWEGLCREIKDQHGLSVSIRYAHVTGGSEEASCYDCCRIRIVKKEYPEENHRNVRSENRYHARHGHQQVRICCTCEELYEANNPVVKS
jgi:hypothetical protein